MALKVLWLETLDDYAPARAKEAGARLGVAVDWIRAADFALAADGQSVGAFAGDRDLAEAYDALVVRSFMPFVSEALTLARLFRAAGKVVVDECLTARGYAMSKMHDYVVLAAAGVGVPRTRQYHAAGDGAAFAAALGYPCVVKAIHGSEGMQVHRAENEAALRAALAAYPQGAAMVQEYLDAAEDFRVIVIGGEALPKYVSRTPAAGDFRTNFSYGEAMRARPRAEAPALAALAERAARTLEREFAAVDIRHRGDEPLVLEVNRRPHFRAFEQASGCDVAGAFMQYLIGKCGGGRV